VPCISSGKEMNMEQSELIDLEYTPVQIEIKTKTIYAKMLIHSSMDSGNFTRIWRGDLERLFELYDRYFFDGFFTENFRDRLSFKISQRMTESGGMTKYYHREGKYDISLAGNLFFQTFEDVQREIKVNGIICNDRLEAAMRILEHEIIHLIEFILFGKSGCSRKSFRHMSRRIFGHRGITHQLVTQTERARKKFNLGVGSRVSFELGGERYTGTIHRITKRATVFVRDKKGDYFDKQGRRYTKYYVPLDQLEHARSAAK